MHNKIDLPDGRIAIVSMGRIDADIGLHVALYLPRAVVAPERIQLIPVGTRPEFKLRLGRVAIPLTPERPWAKANEDSRGVTFDAAGRVPARYAQALANAMSLTLLDDACPLAGQDVCVMSAELGIEGLGNGLKLLARSR